MRALLSLLSSPVTAETDSATPTLPPYVPGPICLSIIMHSYQDDNEAIVLSLVVSSRLRGTQHCWISKHELRRIPPAELYTPLCRDGLYILDMSCLAPSPCFRLSLRCVRVSIYLCYLVYLTD
ncbi:hypothetical protein ARMGADRAFT_124816 [Armillaria gallica]|uniref:Uncharacterized protein n=1 Tax=Armillaria gallica TaxID=47427 RepID=A0A2H3DHV0_ARMGA|nr:hypothetical protein ARMGADRAFT_124816 [Armillaria gallica]